MALTNNEELELYENLVKEKLSQKTYFLHGNSSPDDAANIATQGLSVLEGRATVSCNLLHAFDWATSTEKRLKYSLSDTQTDKGSSGKVFIVIKPEQYSFGFANFTNFVVNPKKMEIRGQPLKWASAYKQIGLFSGQNVDERRKQLEAITMKERSQVTIDKNKLLLQLDPSQQTSKILEKLDRKIKNFRPINSKETLKKLKNSLDLGQTPEHQEIIKELVESTIESIVIIKLRTKILEIKATQGYTIYNYANQTTTHFNKAPNEVRTELLRWQKNLQEGSILDIKWLNAYAKDNIKHLLKMLEN